MTQFFGIPIATLTSILLVITAVIIGSVVILALSNLIFFKIGVRNIPRRRTQMLLIVFALMLSTTLLSSVLSTGDVLTATVQSVAVYNWGNVDELIESSSGSLNPFPDGIYYRLRRQARNDPDIAAIGAALRADNLLVADETSRQVRSKVSALAVLPDSEQGFGGMQDLTSKRQFTIAGLQPDQVYLNQTCAQLLNAKAGDTLYLYSQDWPGRRYAVHVAAIVGDNGLVGDNPYVVSQLQTLQHIENKADSINKIFVANSGGGGVNGVNLSDQVTQDLQHWLPRIVHPIQVKQQGVQNSQKAEDIFSRIFSLFALFALAIGLLLILLIFVLLAAERRAEMGMARAIGVQRFHLVLMFLFEGTVYDLLASFVGLLIGLGAGALLVSLLGPILARFNFPLKLTLQPNSLIVSYCLGVIFTFLSVALSSWLVSRMNVVEAIRDLPEQARPPFSLGELGLRLLRLARQFLLIPFTASSLRQRLKIVRRTLLGLLPEILLGFVRELTWLGFLPLLAGLWLAQTGLENQQIIPFSLGLSFLAIGAGLLIRMLLEQGILLSSWLFSRERHLDSNAISKVTTQIFATLTGAVLVAYWGLPFDVLANLGLPRFQGGIEVFFLAGMMMVLGAVWVIIANAQLLVNPLLALCAHFPGLYTLSKLASSYPLHRRFRTALSVMMFSMVVFAMTMMAVITNSMQNTYVDINVQTGGYDIQATAYFKALTQQGNADNLLADLHSSLVQHGVNPNDFSAIGVRSTTAVGVIQLSATTPRWSLYPAQIVSGSFLQGYGLHLTARASGFSSDNAVWQALQTHPDYALIDSSALPYNPNVVNNSPVYDPSVPQAADAGGPTTPPGFDPRYTFSMSGVYQGDKVFPATPVWAVGGTGGQAAMKLTVIGVVDNSDSAHYGLYISRNAYTAANDTATTTTPPALADAGLTSTTNAPNALTYYFKVAPGQDKRTLALALGSAYLDNGLETTVLEDAIWQVRGPRIFLSQVLLGVVGMTLLLGVAALAITGTRAVIERRQQIGMLRALGCSRRMIQAAFLLESFLVGVLGSALGVVLGLLLARNIFAANFFEQYQTGLTYGIPWQQLALIVGVSLLASFLGAILPAWQSGKVMPAEALRYE